MINNGGSLNGLSQGASSNLADGGCEPWIVRVLDPRLVGGWHAR